MELRVQLFEQGKLPCADASPRGPEIEQYHSVLQILRAQWSTGGGLYGKSWGGLADTQILDFVNVPLGGLREFRIRKNFADTGERSFGLAQFSGSPAGNAEREGGCGAGLGVLARLQFLLGFSFEVAIVALLFRRLHQQLHDALPIRVVGP